MSRYSSNIHNTSRCDEGGLPQQQQQQQNQRQQNQNQQNQNQQHYNTSHHIRSVRDHNVDRRTTGGIDGRYGGGGDDENDDNDEDGYVQVIHPPTMQQQQHYRQKQQQQQQQQQQEHQSQQHRYMNKDSSRNSTTSTNTTSSRSNVCNNIIPSRFQSREKLPKSFLNMVDSPTQAAAAAAAATPPPPSPLRYTQSDRSTYSTVSLPVHLTTRSNDHYRNNNTVLLMSPTYLQRSQSTSAPSTTSIPVPTTGTTMMKRTVSSLSQYQSTSITKHYAISNQILAAFESHYTNQLYMTAYCVGLQFIETALLEIPKHGYYKSSRHEHERMQSTVDAARVAHLLQNLLQQASTIVTVPSIAVSSIAVTTSNTIEPESLQAAAMIGNIERIEELQMIAIQQIEEASIDQVNNNNSNNNNTKSVVLSSDPKKTTTKNSTSSSRNNHKDDTDGMVNGWVVCDYIATAAANTLQACHGGGSGSVDVSNSRHGRNVTTNNTVLSSLDRAILPSPTQITSQNKDRYYPYNDHNVDYSTSKHKTNNSNNNNNDIDGNYTNHDNTNDRRYYESSSGSVLPTPPLQNFFNKFVGNETSNSVTTDCKSTILMKGSFQENATTAISNRTQSTPSKYSQFESSIVPPPPPLVSSKGIYENNNVRDYGNAKGSLVENDSQLQLEKALFLSGLEVSVMDHPVEREYLFEPDDTSIPVRVPMDPPEQYGTYDNHRNQHDDNTTLSSSLLFPPSLPSPNARRTSSLNNNSVSLLQLQTLASLYHDDFNALQGAGRVRISFANTFQGRIPESTNGCAVIAPLLCIHHLLNDDVIDEYLSDDEIIQVIDIETPIILSSIRQELGLTENAFLIPSDVHDYLMKQGQLSQSQFLTVTGGNILDDRHLMNFIEELENANRNDNHHHRTRIAATFFFHEHVVAVVKVRRSGHATSTTVSSSSSSSSSSSLYCYEFLDSLPVRSTLRRDDETNEDLFRRFGIEIDNKIGTNEPSNNCNKSTSRYNNNDSSLYGSTRASSSNVSEYMSLYDDTSNDVNDHKPTQGDDNDSSSRMYENHEHLLIPQKYGNSHNEYEEITNGEEEGCSSNCVIIPRTARIRCSDTEALAALLRWYACSMFTSENISYINQYDWDDATCDFDPRVFQAFVWTS
jgi:hypothetical protein